MNLKGKILLIIGGINLSQEIIKQARKQGAIIYVTDYLENSPGKKLADKSFMVSATDVEAVVDLIKQENVDGVLTGFVDLLLPYLVEICEKANLPCYIASKEQIEITSEKDRFKALCRRNNIPVVPEYDLLPPFTQENTQHIQFPVLIKPIDNSGARGIFICADLAELQANYPKALTFSKSKNILIERYITAKEATAFYLIQDGEITLSAMGDRHMKKFQEGIIPLPVAYTFPSVHLQHYQQNLNDKVIAMFRSIGIKNGMIFIQMFVEETGFVFYEMGFRLTGSLEYKLVNQLNGVNPLECMINYALTGKMSETKIVNKLNPNHQQLGVNITVLAKPGAVGSVIGLEKTKEHKKIIDVVTNYSVGDVIPAEALGTLRQVFARVFFVADDKEELLSMVRFIQDTLQVTDLEGKSLLIQGFDITELG